MAEPADLLRAWQDVIKQLAGAAAPVAGASEEAMRQLLAPLQRQADLLEQGLRRQLDFEKELAGRVLGPLRTLLDVLDQSASAMRTQAQAFEAASAAFKQSAELLELQATLIDQAARSLRDPAQALKTAGQAGKKRVRRTRTSTDD